MLSRSSVLVAVLAMAALAGCGSATPAPRLRGVQLTLESPRDASTVDADRVELRGVVTPAASEVEVLGRHVDVAGGTFATEVPLEEGSNLIDVSASAPGRRPATTAVRVVREVPVEIPDVVGDDADQAIADLEALKLEVERRKGGGLLDSLLPGSPAVCTIEPAAGTTVKPGTTVTVETAKSC